jgi:hypothetical protein
MRRLGVAHTDEDVLVLHQRRISPRGVAMFQQAGYMLTRDELVQVSARGVTADEAFALKNIGYDFSIDDLMKLRQWEVPTDYVIALWSDDFRPLAADQIVELRLRRITPEMVQAMRQHNAASHETLATPSPDPAAPPRPLSEADLEALRKALEP